MPDIQSRAETKEEGVDYILKEVLLGTSEESLQRTTAPWSWIDHILLLDKKQEIDSIPSPGPFNQRQGAVNNNL